PRTVRSLEVLPTPATSEAWRRARLRLTWDVDDPDPALAGLDLPFGLAFGRARGLPAVESLAVGTSGGAWFNRFPMPYRTRALLRVDTGSPLEGRIRVRTTRGADADAGYLRGARCSTAISGSGATAPRRVAGSGRAHLAGLFLVSEGGPLTSATAGTGVLIVTGKPLASLASLLEPEGRATPARSEFGPVRGSLVPGSEAGRPADRSAVYRWFLSDPIPLGERFAVELAPRGEEISARPAPVDTRTAAVFWYSEDPGSGRDGR
ncbi:MAG: DUF2961 domain-containing protein, partial [Planctomycetia bacterium]|nr:DUF2961 domain-containing protein [Planctomycetia bacterium]